MDEWLAALEAAEFARALRRSVWVYPLVNAGHLLGVALLVGGIIPLDLKLIGAWRSQPVAPLWRVLTRSAAVGLMLAIVFGFLLFSTRATEYAASPFFVAKMIVVGAATANALALRFHARDPASPARWPPRLRIAAAISLAGWLSALTLGRLVGYF